MSEQSHEEFCKALLDFDKHLTSTVLVEPSNDGYKVDYAGLTAYARKKYNGKISKMTKKEKMMFFTKIDKD
jgi:hypothetical protein